MKKHPTEKQIQMLNQMMYYAFVELRILGRSGKAEQAADLADAFHNLPIEMFSKEFDWDLFQYIFLEPYQQKYPRPEYGAFNYISFLERIRKEV